MSFKTELTSTEIKTRDRQAVIEYILGDLRRLEANNFPNRYAIRENIYFFESVKSFPRYLRWSFSRAIFAILENYQNADGSVTVSIALRPFIFGIDKIINA